MPSSGIPYAVRAVRKHDFRNLQELMSAKGDSRQKKFHVVKMGLQDLRVVLSSCEEYSVRPDLAQVIKESKYGVLMNSGVDTPFRVFQAVHLEDYKSFIDLGCGLGDISFLVSLFGLRSTGIDHDPEVTAISITFKDKLAQIVPDVKEVRFLFGDQAHQNLDFSQYDVFYHFNFRDSKDIFKKRFAEQALPGQFLF